MRTVQEHARVIAGLLEPTGPASLPLADAVGLVLAQDLVAPIDLPPFANSAMDGYAVRAADVAELPVTLPVSQDIPAGRTDTGPLAPGTAARIMTGAPLPPGAEVIVQVERTDGGESVVRIDGAPPPGVHVRTRGEDVAAGTVVLAAGTVVGTDPGGGSSGAGFRRAPGPTSRPGTGAVDRHRTRRARTAARPRTDLRVQRRDAGGRDDSGQRARHHRAFRRGRRRASARCVVDGGDRIDLIVTSGGVSAGAYEVVKDALADQGVEFAKVAMQPGMPQGAGRFRRRAGGHPAGQSGQLLRLVRGVPAAGDPRRHGSPRRHPADCPGPACPRRWTPRPANASSVGASWTPSPERSRRGADRARICCRGSRAPTA